LQQINEEIDRLTREQTDAMKAATFMGMTPADAKSHDERRRKITSLMQQLRQLQAEP
jgi:hypothetical protein